MEEAQKTCTEDVHAPCTEDESTNSDEDVFQDSSDVAAAKPVTKAECLEEINPVTKPTVSSDLCVCNFSWRSTVNVECY